MVKLKITVLKRMLNEDLAKEYCVGEVGPCEIFNEGQEFIYDPYGDGSKPENFCENAWVDIYKTLFTLSANGSFSGWMKNEKSIITCCTDGIRPVIFKIETLTD